MNIRTYSWTKAATVITKIMELMYEIAAVAFLVGAALVITVPDALAVDANGVVSAAIGPMHLSLTNVILYDHGDLSIGCVVFYLAYGALCSFVAAKASYNVWKILSASQHETPFQWRHVRLLRESGFLFIGLTLSQIVFALILMPFGGVSVNMKLDGLVLGIIVLCIAQILAQGVQMQEDVDGLV